MSQRERGKAKALRIDLSYHRNRNWLTWARWTAASSALLVAVLYAGWVIWLDRPGIAAGSSWRISNLSTGPLAKVHASFESDCARCHGAEMGIGLSTDAWQIDKEPRLRQQEQKCQECHFAENHSREMLKDINLDRDCARCHRDHQGRTALLADVSNKLCVECHGNLKAACKADANTQLTNAIKKFSLDSHATHPSSTGSDKTFRSLAVDTGRVKFDHAQHLLPGQVDAGSRGGFQVAMLPPGSRATYAKNGQSESDLVQLSCNNCHEPLVVSPRNSSNAVTNEEGRYYAPVNFEKHCAACHQLTFAGQTAENLPLPHVATRAEYARLLTSAQTAGALQGQIVMAGDNALSADDSAKLPASSRPFVLNRQRVEAGVDAVFKRCEQCHDPRDTEPASIERALAGTLEPLIPQRWLKFGYFDHAAHSTIERCELCHQIPNVPGPADDHRKVFISGPDSCVWCHRDISDAEPTQLRSAADRVKLLGNQPQPTWASDNCTECHRYHWTRPEKTTGSDAAVTTSASGQETPASEIRS